MLFKTNLDSLGLDEVAHGVPELDPVPVMDDLRVEVDVG